MTEREAQQETDAPEVTDMVEVKSSRKRVILKITLIAVILIAIAAIWVIKNRATPKVTAEANAVLAQTEDSGETTIAEEQDEDFALETDAIDLAALFTYKLPIIIDFGSDSCIPCQEMAPVLKSATRTIGERRSSSSSMSGNIRTLQATFLSR